MRCPYRHPSPVSAPQSTELGFRIRHQSGNLWQLLRDRRKLGSRNRYENARQTIVPSTDTSIVSLKTGNGCHTRTQRRFKCVIFWKHIGSPALLYTDVTFNGLGSVCAQFTSLVHRSLGMRMRTRVNVYTITIIATNPPQSFGKSASLSHNYATKSHWLQCDAENSPPPKLSFPFDDHHPYLIHPSLDWLHSSSQTASGSNQPFFHSTLSGSTEQQVDIHTDQQMG